MVVRNIKQKLIVFSRENVFGAVRGEMRCDTLNEVLELKQKRKSKIKEKIKSEDSM